MVILGIRSWQAFSERNILPVSLRLWFVMILLCLPMIVLNRAREMVGWFIIQAACCHSLRLRHWCIHFLKAWIWIFRLSLVDLQISRMWANWFIWNCTNSFWTQMNPIILSYKLGNEYKMCKISSKLACTNENFRWVRPNKSWEYWYRFIVSVGWTQQFDPINEQRLSRQQLCRTLIFLVLIKTCTE